MEIFISIIALSVAIMTAYSTHKQYQENVKTSQANTVLHFTQEYFSLFKDTEKEIKELIKEAKWANKYWSLLSSEFYFYKANSIPKHMYALWIIEVVELYATTEARGSHKKFLDFYNVLYPEMGEFFTEVYKISKIAEIEGRHKAIKKHIMGESHVISWTPIEQ